MTEILNSTWIPDFWHGWLGDEKARQKEMKSKRKNMSEENDEIGLGHSQTMDRCP